MHVYTVHEPTSPTAGRIERGESLAFVRDGFSWRAAIFPPIWFAARGQWLGILIYVAAVVLISLLLTAIGAKEDWAGLVIIALHVVFGFEAAEIQRWSLGRAGWREIATVSGPDRDTCERRFFDGWLNDETAAAIYPLPPAEVRALKPASIEARLRDRLEQLRGRFETKPGS